MRNLFYKALFLFSFLFLLLLLFTPSSFAQSYSSYYKTGYWPVGYSPLNTGGQNAFCSSNPCGIKTFDNNCQNFDATCAISPHAGCDRTGAFCAVSLMGNDPNAQCNSTNHPYGDSTNYAAYCGPLEYTNCNVYGCYGFQFVIPGGSTPSPTPTPTPTPTAAPACTTYSTYPPYTYKDTCAGTNGTFTDNCSGNNINMYSCNAANACQLFTAPCNVGETCIVQSNGMPVCVAGLNPTVPQPPSFARGDLAKLQA